MAVFFGTLYDVTCPVYATVHVFTGQVTFYRYQKNTATGNPVDPDHSLLKVEIIELNDPPVTLPTSMIYSLAS